MDWQTHSHFLLGMSFGANWSAWEAVGWLGNGLFTSRFFVQWWATERQQRVVIPPVFWWLSMAGSGCLLAYGLHQRNSVFVFAYLFTWIPYIRNLMVGSKHRRGQRPCPQCRAVGAAEAKYCAHCGVKLAVVDSGA